MSTQLPDLLSLPLTQDSVITYIQSILNAFSNLDGIVGDTPVSEQLSIALSQMASKSHTHEDYVTRKEYDTLKKQVDMLTNLVGDTSVSEQINVAIKQNI